MSSENVKLIEAALGEFASSEEPAWQVLGDEVEVHDHDIMDAGEYRGHAGFGRWLEDWASAWSESTMEPEDFLDAGDRVVAFILQKTTGHSSGVALERHDAMVFEVREGKIVRLDYYNNRDEALKQAGLGR
jgi:ketosteroid isomerase-like protein